MENGRNAPATKGDVDDAVNRAKDDVLEAVRGIETKLLNAFYAYAKSNASVFLRSKAMKQYFGAG